MIKNINAFIVFLLEIIMLISIVDFGMSRQWNLSPRLLFTLLVLLIAILLWSVFAAPKSAYRLKMPYLFGFRLFMFSLAAFLLFQAGHSTPSIIVMILALLTQAISYFSE